MTIFGNARLGRVGYAAFLVAMICFDFAKAPVEHYVMTLHDQATKDLSSPAVMALKPEANFTINGHQMPLMPKAMQDAFREAAKPGHRNQEADIQKLREATQRSVDEMMAGGPATNPEVARLVDARAFYQILHVVLAIAMTAITVVGLLWMVSGRLRDIGTSQYLLPVLLAPFFVPRLVAVSDPVRLGITVFFFAVLLILAFIPAPGSGPLLPRRPPAVPPVAPTPTAPPVAGRRQAVQFGKLGSR